MSSGRRLTAAEAQAWGLVSEVYEAEAFGEATAAYAAEWAAKPTRGVAMTKRLFDEAAGKGLEETLALEAELQGEATRTEDFAEGVAAFLEKRPPEFRGR
jgi:2-(1,2-epoxy-1,2-dihydrophenyl)acetyl-CoA isomerase